MQDNEKNLLNKQIVSQEKEIEELKDIKSQNEVLIKSLQNNTNQKMTYSRPVRPNFIYDKAPIMPNIQLNNKKEIYSNPFEEKIQLIGLSEQDEAVLQKTLNMNHNKNISMLEEG